LPDGILIAPSIMVAAYPIANEKAFDPEAERIMDCIIEIVRSIRNAKAEYKVESAKWIEAHVYADELTSAITSQSAAIEALAKVRPLTISERQKRQIKGEKALVIVLKESDVVLPWAGMVDIAAEKQRLEKEININKREIDRLEQRLKDTDFISKAPEAVIEKERSRLLSYKDKLQRLEQELAQLNQ
jgi:valyl-tRNA synthetase